MAGQTIRLTQKAVNSYPAAEQAYRVFDSVKTGLCLYVGTSGRKTWYWYYTGLDKKRQSYRIGPVNQFTLERVRKEIDKLAGQLASGNDPALEKRKSRQAEKQARSRTLGAFLEGDYWKLVLSRQKSGQAGQQRILSAWAPFIDRDMSTITPHELDDHRAERLKGFESLGPATPQTLNRDRAALHSLFQAAVKQGLIKSNPAHKDVFPSLKTEKDSRVRYLGQRDDVENLKDSSGNKIGERARFDAALRTLNPKLQALIGLAMNTGCRRGELFTLTWSNINLKPGSESLTVTGEHAKSGKKRIIPLNSKAVEIIQKWRKEQGNIAHISGIVFPSQITGKSLDHIHGHWRILRRRAQLTDFRFHDLRHDFASRLVMARVSLYEVKDLLGHASITTTERYAHLADEQLRSAVEVL